MIPFALPTRRVTVADGVQRLEFREGSPAPSGNWYVFGGIAWPEPMAGRMGAALVIGFETKSRVTYVLAEHEFSLVEPAAEAASGEISPVPSLAEFIGKAWAEFGCEVFYWSGLKIDFVVFVRQVSMSLTIKPRPSLPQIDWLDDERAAAIVYQWIEGGRLRHSSAETAPLCRGLMEHGATREMNRPLWALASALAAFEMSGNKDGQPKRVYAGESEHSFRGLV